jgi:hypothetical protein
MPSRLVTLLTIDVVPLIPSRLIAISATVSVTAISAIAISISAIAISATSITEFIITAVTSILLVGLEGTSRVGKVLR